jgi:hypothetical protein
MAFFNPDAALVIHRGKLPHWRQEGTTYFVTFHLADSLPRFSKNGAKRGRFAYYGKAKTLTGSLSEPTTVG